MKLTVIIIVTLLLSISCNKTSPTKVSEDPNPFFEFPTSNDKATFHFVSYPDLFNWNIKYPQPGWEDALDWYLGGMKIEGPAFTLIAGDIADARWNDSAAQVISLTNEYWTAFRKRFDDKGINLFVAPGDHEYGDNKGLGIIDLARVFGEQFTKILKMPTNGPSHKIGRAFAFSKDNLAVITLDTFEDTGKRMSVTVSGKQLEWLKQKLIQYRDKEFIIVQGHAPVIGPVNTHLSSGLMIESGNDTTLWNVFKEYGVDAYFCGEHHAITTTHKDGIWQIVHGALWGYDTTLNYLRGSINPGKLTLKLFEFDVEYSGGKIGNTHPVGKGPYENVAISEKTKLEGPEMVGMIEIVAKRGCRNETVVATGVFSN